MIKCVKTIRNQKKYYMWGVTREKSFGKEEGGGVEVRVFLQALMVEVGPPRNPSCSNAAGEPHSGNPPPLIRSFIFRLALRARCKQIQSLHCTYGGVSGKKNRTTFFASCLHLIQASRHSTSIPYLMPVLATSLGNQQLMFSSERQSGSDVIITVRTLRLFTC